jgi:hypothetical protein
MGFRLVYVILSLWFLCWVQLGPRVLALESQFKQGPNTVESMDFSHPGLIFHVLAESEMALEFENEEQETGGLDDRLDWLNLPSSRFFVLKRLAQLGFKSCYQVESSPDFGLVRNLSPPQVF